MTPAEKIERAEHAQRLLNDDLLREVLTEMREDAVSRLVEDKKDPGDNIADIRAVETLRATLQSIVTTGQNAAKKG
jgi:hypothetical protein